ncbi:acetyltransferase [Clostridium botulinum B str. Osaka05]|uniref:Acetyltransferase n=1 Tax=Clostridium botulinum B str. Osaka05 TaxID=1407017 RepID=A0A0S6U4Y3_CLOBO|nr:GNAT family N-acetyltransferase [Clostridium botulinum]AVQ47084.1 GNAT family N-acetyltransferase [Clostridium botulinum]AVQ50559.1 GNAT family N-acetyltransferase [Clostridium botulinum]GAE01730.1 acetyltransferase [Clostridium botulinum B str. Osaka05]
MNFKIKKFNELTVEEIYEILKIRNEVFIVEQKCPYDDCDGKDKNAYHLFYMEEGKVISYLRILEKGLSYDEISIGRVLVDKDYRGKGLARKSILQAIDFIQNNLKENSIRISAQHYLMDFYKSFGFEPVSEVYLEDNIPHIEMLYKKNISI